MPAKGSRKSRTSSAKDRKKPVSGQVKAGTIFPVGRSVRLMKEARLSERISVSAGAYIAGVLEYICAEILEMAGNVCEEAGRKTIAPKHINLGVRADQELNKMMSNIVISQGGMLPNVHEYLVPPKKGGKKAGGKEGGHNDASQPL